MLEAYGLTDTGCVRKNNEDYFLVEPHLGLYLVADGMGGAQAGEKASRLAAQTVRDVVGSAANGSAPVLREAFQEANRRVIQLASSDSTLEGMGTTLVAVLDCGDRLEVSSVGDSRCYQYVDDRISAVTVDQTWVEEVGRKLGISEEQLRNHPMRHVLTMAVGASPTLKIHNYTLVRRPGTHVLLSSDGLHGVIEEETIAEALGSERTLEEKCHYLIEAARGSGGPDNITVVILRTAR